MSEPASITCPVCGATSFNENDIRERYCGSCHTFQEPLLLADQDLVVTLATEPSFGIQMGEVFLHTHPPSRCVGEPCPIHHPSDHHMRDWQLNWRADRGLMERMCPLHHTGHPDPDGLDHERRSGRDVSGIHGCCGCCKRPV